MLHEHDLAFCSRSGPPQVPWLEPDINDHLTALSEAGAAAVVMVPVGFVSDHMEVIYDLDTEALATAERLGLPARRAATPGADPRFVALVRDLLLERATVERGRGGGPRGRGRHRPALGPLPRRLLPQPAGRPAGAVRPMSRPMRRPTSTPWPTWPSTRPAQAAALVRDRATRRVTVAATKSTDVDVVTEADRASEELIRELIGRARPDDAFLGEEGDDVAGTSGVRWVVDPIDGTVNFLYGLPQYAVSIAAEVDGEMVAGIVLDVAVRHRVRRPPGSRRRVVALRDGEPIAVRGPAPLGAATDRHRLQLRARRREIQGAAVARLLPAACATSDGWAPAPSTCVWWPRAGSTATSRRGSTSGTTRPAD